MIRKINHQYALVSKSRPSKVLKYFGKKKPSPNQIKKAEQLIQFWENIHTGKIKGLRPAT